VDADEVTGLLWAAANNYKQVTGECKGDSCHTFSIGP